MFHVSARGLLISSCSTGPERVRCRLSGRWFRSLTRILEHMSSPTTIRSEIRFAYPLGLLLVVASALELLARIWPVKPYLVQWRFQTELALINGAPVMLIGFLILLLVAWAAEQPGVLRALSIVAALFGVLLAPVCALLLLDYMDVRVMANANMREALRNNTVVALVRGGLSALAAFSLGLGAWRLSRTMTYEAPKSRARGSRQEPEESEFLILGDTPRN